MLSEEDNVHTDLFAVSHNIYTTDARANITPTNPVPEQIPSNFNVEKFKRENRNILHLPPHTIKSGRYSSLRWYGDGPY